MGKMRSLNSLKGHAWGVTRSKKSAIRFKEQQKKLGIKTRIRKSKGPFKYRIYRV